MLRHKSLMMCLYFSLCRLLAVYVLPLLRCILYSHTLQKRTRNRITEAREAAKTRSLSPTYNPLWDLPYGDNLMGIYGATPPELLHQYGLGIEMYAFKFVWEMLSRHAAEEGRAPGTYDQRLDERFMAFCTRHADADMPRFSFTTGTKKLPYLTSGEYRALMYQVRYIPYSSYS